MNRDNVIPNVIVPNGSNYDSELNHFKVAETPKRITVSIVVFSSVTTVSNAFVM